MTLLDLQPERATSCLQAQWLGHASTAAGQL
jgi:hypothetical protein